MKILFYLPANHAFWFDKVVAPMMRCVARDAEVHVVVPPVWSGSDSEHAQFATGITAEQLKSCLDLSDVRWHIIDGDDHPSLRTSPAAPEALIDAVSTIGADYTFCRSADVRTPGAFPGKVRYLMEGEFPPLPPALAPAGSKRPWRTPARSCQRVTLMGPGLYDHGIVPPLDPEQRGWLLERTAPMWRALHAWRADAGRDRDAYLVETGLPRDRRIIAVPLDYDGPHSYFREVHGVEPSNAGFVEKLLAQLDEDFVLALTLHPLQQGSIARDIAALDKRRIRIVHAAGPLGNPTLSLLQHCDGVIVTDTKAFAEGPFFGKPMLRLSRFASGDWLNLYTDFREMQADLRAGMARVAAPEDVALWYAFHHANDAFAADDPRLTLDTLIGRIERPVDPARWEAHLGSYLDEKFGALIAAYA